MRVTASYSFEGLVAVALLLNYFPRSGTILKQVVIILISFKLKGRLHQGKLHEMVVMRGILSADPQSLCSHRSFPGIMFVGQYSNGVPKGTCWRGLKGGAWLYGQVDSKGEFTGELWRHKQVF